METAMRDYQREFLRFAIDTGVLRFGDFVLKSGRRSPYFFNAGLFDTGACLARLGRFYATAIEDAGLEFDMLFGPAYKGIGLAAATAIALAERHGRDCPFAFNRKEPKNHGEGGRVIGRALSGQVLIIDDVISAGTSVAESVALIESAGARPAAVLIALDRMERGRGERSATGEVRATHAIPVASIVTLDDLIAFLSEERIVAPGMLEAMLNYRREYGVFAGERYS